jgi:hypothetical protein
MSKQHIVTVYEDDAGALQVTPDELEVKFGHTVMFFSDGLDIEVDFAADDNPFDHLQFDVPAASYMIPEPVTEKPREKVEHHYIIFAFNAQRGLLQQIDPIIIVDPYPLEDMVKTARIKDKEPKVRSR